MYCNPCAEYVELEAFFNHVRVMHSEHEPERWPDGEFAVLDKTVENTDDLPW